ncbi:MAG: FAD-binding oxidoreductase [Alicyclobacillaceae bacterium]|nr:FAD-binding oxidoreductase [Alicyclobacillaceae bacterium]
MQVDGERTERIARLREELKKSFEFDRCGGCAGGGPVASGGPPGAAAVFPRDEGEAADLVAWAVERGAPLLPLGSGSQWLPGPGLEEVVAVVRTSRLAGVVDYEPKDLVLVARAGTRWSDLLSLTAENGQWLPVDPLAGPEATLGGVVSCAASGPHRLLYGPVRDWVIGLRAVTPDGPVRAGGKVVKNVAGYDAVKLFVGARGTLGIVTEVAVKLRPLPPERHLIAFAADERRRASEFAGSLFDGSWVAAAAEWVSPALAAACGLPERWTVLLGCDEPEASAAAHLKGWCELAGRAGLPEIGRWAGADADRLWARYREALNRREDVRFRWVVWPAQAAEEAEWAARRWRELAGDAAGRCGPLISAGLGTGEVRAAWPALEGPLAREDAARWVRDLAARIGRTMGRIFVERAPASWSVVLQEALRLGDGRPPLSETLRRAMDPGGIFAPGRLLGGI